METQPFSCHGDQGLLRLHQRLRQHGLQQPPALLIGLAELLLQLIAEGHQFVDLGDDAVLFGEGGGGELLKVLLM